MNIDGTFTFPGPRHLVWDLLQDPQVLARALPGTERLTSDGPDKFTGVMKVSVGPVTAASFDVSVTLADKRQPEHFVMRIQGRGRVGHVRGDATVDLAEEGADATLMRYSSQIQVGGTIAAVGQRLLDSVAHSMLKQAFDALEREVHSKVSTGRSTP
jgi:carbon monoxide dehydrogenase subunit G